MHNSHPFIEFRVKLQELNLRYIDSVAVNLCPNCYHHVLKSMEPYQITAPLNTAVSGYEYMGFMCHMTLDEKKCFLHLQR